MKVALVAALPFHRWCLASLDEALLSHPDVNVRWIVHTPEHAHHWLTSSPETAAMRELRAYDPDLIVCADYPYGPLQEIAPVVALRHSLASRGNTYEPEQAEADWIVTFGPLDEALLLQRLGVRCPPRLPFGAPWLDDVRYRKREPGIWRFARESYAPREAARPAEDRDDGPAQPPLGDRGRRSILFAPTWNRWTDVGAVGRWATSRPDLDVWIRPHAATAWREPERAREAGFAGVLDSSVHPAVHLAQADLLLTDVSGIGLMGACVADAALPVVQLHRAFEGPQVDRHGPEWTERDNLGHVVHAIGEWPLLLNSAVIDALLIDPYRDSRRALRARLLHGAEDPTWSASRKLAAWIATSGTAEP